MKTRLNDLFDQMDDEEGNKLDDKIQIESEKNEDIEYLISILNELNNDIVAENAKNLIEFLDTKISKKYSSRDISKLSFFLKDEIVDEYNLNVQAGLFFSYLINNSKNNSHSLYFQNNEMSISSIGRENTKNITIYGNVKNSTGDHMIGGEIIVNGNSMHYTAMLMSGGRLVIKGNVGDLLGFQMTGGTIEVFGDLASLSKNILGGNIYHKGKQIVKNGQILDRTYLK